jgi:hypothetical protein
MPDNVLSDSWNKDVITLEEAKQQSRKPDHICRHRMKSTGNLRTLFKQWTLRRQGSSESWNKDTVTLAEAQATDRTGTGIHRGQDRSIQ